MNYFGAIVIVVLFVILLKKFRLVENSVQVISISRMALSDIRNPELTDDQKETRVQKHALQLFRFFFILTVSVVLSFAIPLGLIWLLDYFSLMSIQAVIDISLSVWFLVASTLFLVVFFWLVAKKR